MGIEHVDVDAHAHLVAELVGIERALAGNSRCLVGPHLSECRIHAHKRCTGALRHIALRCFQIRARLVFERQGFFDAILNRVAGKQGHVDVETHRVGVGARKQRRGHTAIVGCSLVAGHQIHGRPIGCIGLLGFQAGHFQREVELTDNGVLGLTDGQPFVHVGGRKLGKIEIRRNGQWLDIGLAH